MPAKTRPVFVRCIALVACIAVGLGAAAAARADDAPKLAVYGFAVNGSAPAGLGAQCADAIGAQIRTAGGVDVLRGAATLMPSQYREDARAKSADFFLIGAIAPVGNRFSVIEQLVRTRTGLLAWSSTLQVTDVAELNGQGALVRQALLDALGTARFPALSATRNAAPAATPAPRDTRAQAFNVPISQPTIAPASTFAVMSFGGTALPSDRAFAVRAVLENIRRRGVSAATAAAVPADLQTAGAQACVDTGAATIVGGTLEETRVPSLTAPPATTASIALQVYDCRTHTLATKPLASTKTTPVGTDAIRAAADEAAAAYFGGPPPEPHV